MTRQHGCGEDKSPTQCPFRNNALFIIIYFSMLYFLRLSLYYYIRLYCILCGGGYLRFSPLINTLTPTTSTPHILPLSAISAEKASLSTFHIAYTIMHMYIPYTGYFLIFLLFSNTFQE